MIATVVLKISIGSATASADTYPAFERSCFLQARFSRLHSAAKFLFTRPPRNAPGIIERSRWLLLCQLAQHGLRYLLRFVS